MTSQAFSTPVGRVSFRLDFYTDKDRWRGRIQHVLSREAAAFDPDDNAVMLAFIAHHLPALCACSDEVIRRGGDVPPRGGAPVVDGGSLRLRFRVQRPGNGGATHVLSASAPFELGYELSSDDEGVWDHGWQCAMDVYVRAVSGGVVQHVHSRALPLDRSSRRGAIHAESPASAGNYRFALVARVMKQGGAPVIVVGSWEDGAVVVL